MKPHGRDCPDRCSQCLGTRARRVSTDATTIDGEPTGRGLDPLQSKPNTFYARRGGLAHGRRKQE